MIPVPLVSLEEFDFSSNHLLFRFLCFSNWTIWTLQPRINQSLAHWSGRFQCFRWRNGTRRGFRGNESDRNQEKISDRLFNSPRGSTILSSGQSLQNPKVPHLGHWEFFSFHCFVFPGERSE
jgi:hypothetical protein